MDSPMEDVFFNLLALPEPPDGQGKLNEIVSQFHTLCLYAINGNYDDEFFQGLFPDRGASWSTDNRIRKLRAILHDQNLAFVHVLHTKGARHIILPEDSNASPTLMNLPTSLQNLVDQYGFKEPAKVAFKDLAAQLKLLLATWQGCEFPGTINNTLAVKLFREQSQPWEAIARRHLQLILSMTKEFVETLVLHITNPGLNTYLKIISKIVESFFEEKSSVLESKLQELLCHYKSDYPQISDTEFRTIIAHKRGKKGHMDQARDLFAKQPELFTEEMHRQLGKMSQSEDVSESEVDELVYKSETYYELALPTFVDNVVILAVENCLIKDLPFMITTDKIKQMAGNEFEQSGSEAAETHKAC
ncbi:hypothetical protein F4821DRAFT_247170 [Hypoxylon rubiginosum]|uniref:Uncharacterized protein n=1 Tax=Hypoxylon rubiginosum TaxID=110542 RepID=A0ACC0CPX1_9PEZI|nr:hypothetical protein F4821DRAFT_247170 [Hypoxylon rubiginosum]